MSDKRTGKKAKKAVAGPAVEREASVPLISDPRPLTTAKKRHRK